MILLTSLAFILCGCDEDGSNSRGDQGQNPGSGAIGEQGTNIGDNSEIDSPGADATSESQGSSRYDPEAHIIEILESIGYDRSYILFTSVEQDPDTRTDMWRLMFEDGFGPLGAAYIADGADKPAYIKFVRPTDTLSPELLQPDIDPSRPIAQPGEDLPWRIANGLGLEEDGYIPLPWMTKPDYKEYRRYASLGEFEVSTHQVGMYFNQRTGGLLSIHFSGADLDPSLQVVIDMDTAIETAVSSMGNSGLDVTHSELIQLASSSVNNGDPVVYWEVMFENGVAQLVNSVDGTITHLMQGRM